ncbi:MAG: hypothetical protein KH135_01540 [Firmicutes bacterium]|nr:hypothetical protein [Bacillota bacterium]
MTRTKKRKLKKKRLFIALAVVLVILLVTGFGIYQVFFKNDKEKQVVKVADKITDGYGYTITDSATKYSKDLFQKLKTELA